MSGWSDVLGPTSYQPSAFLIPGTDASNWGLASPLAFRAGGSNLALLRQPLLYLNQKRMFSDA